MATCRECLHYLVCRHASKTNEEFISCSQYKPESDYVKRERGEWIEFKANWLDLDKMKGEGILVNKCSLCGSEFINAKYNFCPYCGADMRKEDNNG